MKLFNPRLFRFLQRCLLFSGAAILTAVSSQAQNPAPTAETPVEWRNLCASTAKELMVVTTESGDTIQGYCVSVQHDELTVRTTDGKIVKIARGTLSKVLARTVPENRLQALGRDMRHGLHEGVKMTFSPLAPVGLVTIPGTLAWGAVAAPFCILGDLFGEQSSQRVLAVH
jgi:hypothetical protein